MADQHDSAPAGAAERDRAADQERLAARMSLVGRKILVLSGKGGVGKSTVAANLALALAAAGRRVGLLDVDIHGPSIPQLLRVDGAGIPPSGDVLQPVAAAHGLKVMSIGFLLANRDDAVIWRGPLKMSVIRQFLADVDWGPLDVLVVDCPPGTGDEPLSVVQLLGDADGAVVVTTPQDLAVADVRRCVRFCEQLNLPVLGVIENMSGFVCPACGHRTDIFRSGGGRAMAADLGVPFLGSVPVDPGIAEAGDAGAPYFQDQPHTPSARAFAMAVLPLLALESP